MLHNVLQTQLKFPCHKLRPNPLKISGTGGVGLQEHVQLEQICNRQQNYRKK